MVPAAGSRRRWLTAAAGLLVAACAGGTGAPAVRRTLMPLRGLPGARLANRVDALGTPQPGSFGAYQPFVFPIAVAASGQDIYIADAGLARIFRYDQSLDAMVVLATAAPGTRLHTGFDGSLYVLDPASSSIRRFSRAGTALPALLPRLPTSRYRDFALDAAGRAFALDVSHLRVDRIEPLGRLAIAEFEIGQAAAVASDGPSLFVADLDCHCVVEWRDGRVLRRLAEGELKQPIALAADRGRLYALDAFDRSISIVHPGGVERFLPAQLGLIAPEGIAAAHGLLYVADGAGHSIALFQDNRGRP